MSDDRSAWESAVDALRTAPWDEVVLVQTGLRWLSDWRDLRDDLDEALLQGLMVAGSIGRATRVVWHDVPPGRIGPAMAAADVHVVHGGWIERLAASVALLDDRAPRRLRVLRLISRDRASDWEPSDSILLRRGETWTEVAGAGGQGLLERVAVAPNTTVLGVADLSPTSGDSYVSALL